METQRQWEGVRQGRRKHVGRERRMDRRMRMNTEDETEPAKSHVHVAEAGMHRKGCSMPGR